MKYYIIAGEASGDLYGSRLIDEIKSIDKKADIRFWGGDKTVSYTHLTLPTILLV